MVPLILMEPADSITKNKFRASLAPVINRPSDLGKDISGVMLDNYAKESANVVDGYTYSPAKMDLFTLLFGAGVNNEGELIPLKWYKDDEGNVLSLDAALEAAASEYFLGFANDFCAFIEGDFTATEADAEGRLFIGGDLSFKKNWNYQIGSGDYGNFTPMNETEEYTNLYGYASAVVGGKLYRINTLSTGHTDHVDRNPDPDRHQNNSTVFYLPEEGLYKSFIVGNVNDSLHYKDKTKTDESYASEFESCEHNDYPGNCTICKADLDANNDIDDHSYIGDTNELAQLYEYDNVKGILEDTFDLLRRRSSSLSQIQATNVSKDSNTLRLDLTNIGDAKTAYYNLDSWGGLSAVEIIVPRDRVEIGKNQYTEVENIETITNLDINLVINCKDEKIGIGNTGFTIKVKNPDGTYYKFKKIENNELVEKDFIQISNFNDKKYTNNHPVSSNILYNFSNATEVTINGNFNGTILAPNAEVSSQSDPSPGHLSGALIAKSFEGGLEFGYRPYRGGNDILGMASGYEVPVEKLIAGTDLNLAGAMFAIKEGDNVISLFESINGVNHVAIPSDVDFTGNTVYMPESIETGSATKDTTSNVSVNTNLVKPLIVKAYDSSDNEITWDSEFDLGDFNIGTTIVLRANQPVDWIQKVYNDTVNFTTNEDNSLTLKINKPIENNDAYNFNVKIKGINSSGNTLYLNVNPVTITATPSSYTIGKKVALNISGVSDDIVVKYKYDNANSYIELDEESSFITDRIGENIKIIAELYRQENENLTKLHETSTIIKGYLPEGMVLAVTPDKKYVVGNDQVSMNVVNAPIGATIKYYFNDNNTAVYTVEKENADTNISYTFNPMVIGESIPIKAEVFIKNSSGNEEKVSPPFETTIKGVLPDMTLKADKSEYTYGDQVELTMSKVPDGFTVRFYQFSNSNWIELQGVQGTTCVFIPTQPGEIQVKADVYYNNTKQNSNDYKSTFTVNLPDMSIYVSEPWEINKNLTLGVTGAPNGSNIKYTIQGPNGYKHETNQYNQYFTTQNAGEYTITATVSMNNVSKELTKVINVIDPSATDSSPTETTSFSIRKGVNRLSTESEQESIEITDPDGKTIKSIKLKTELIGDNSNYSLDVKFYDANNVQKGDTVTVDNNNKDNPINCPDGEVITKIVVEAALGAVKVKSYDVTYTEPCKSVTRTAPFNLQTNSENSYVIDTDVFRNLVASDSSDNKLTDYDSITFTLSSNAAAPNTGVKYWLYKGDQQVEHSDTESFYNGSFTINDLSSRGITKIVIRAKDDTALPIVSYSIKSLTATDTELKPVDNNKEIIHTYVIEEIEAPHGFFPTTDKYEVNVVESFDLENISVVNGKYYPNSVDTVITVNKITKNSDGTENKTSVYETKLRIKYGEKDNIIDTNTRIIEVMNGEDVGDTFTIVKSSDALTGVNQIDSVQYNGSELDIDLTKAGIITVGENKYYFNPDTMMIVPMPSENIKFENTPGLLFKKVDDRGYAVKDVEITLTPSTNENGESLWSWVEGTTSEQLINVSQLTPGNVYCISEDDDPDDIYITAPDIFFKVVNNDGVKTIRFGSTAADLDVEGKYQTLDLINNREIRMVDMRIVGVELEINKVDESGKPLTGAKFDLYADVGEGVPLKSGIEVDNNGKATVNLADVDNSTYVENGYLKPGNYYLIETVIPEHLTDPSNKWYEDPGKIKFRVKDDFTVEYINEQTGGNTGGSGNIGGTALGVDAGDSGWGPWTYWLVTPNGEAMMEPEGHKDQIEQPLENITRIYVKIKDGYSKYDNGNKFDCYVDNGLADGQSDNYGDDLFADGEINKTFDPPRDLYQFKIFGYGVEYEKVELESYDGTKYVYPATSAASLEDETAVVDETGEGTESESGESTETESGESTEGETGENTGEETPAVERELLEVDNTNPVKVLTVTNKEDDNERDVNVEKRWYDDTGFDDLRPDVTFTLYQSETEITDRSQLTPDKIYYQKDENGAFILDDDNHKIPYTITITEPDANGKWTGKFTGLPTKYRNSNDEYVDYHYYIVETEVDGYSIKGYSKDADGTLVAENKLDPVSVKATKNWSDPTGIGTTKPESITVQLQVKVGGTWTNVEGKTLTLTAANNWTDEFTGLVKGQEYRLTESSVNGWEVESNPGSVVNGASTENLTITNKPKEVEKGSLSISKLWQNAQGGELTTPNVSEVYVKLYRKVNKLWPVGQPLRSVYNEDGELVTVGVVDDYARLLQYSLYFYDANMCGEEVTEKSALTWRANCHQEDNDPGVDGVDGGFHDAGDHVMFGLPQGYSASMLGWSFYEFNTSVNDPDKKVYDKLGQTEHFKNITEYFCDFFVDSVHYVNDDPTQAIREILVQKGHGNTDHKYWGTPEKQNLDEKNHRIDEEQMYWRSEKCSDIAAEYAAALALAYLNFYDQDAPNEEKEKYQEYLDVAKKLFAFAKINPAPFNEWGVNKDETQTDSSKFKYPGFYSSDDCSDDILLAAAWLSIATNDDSYVSGYENQYKNSSWALSWNDVNLAAAIANAHRTGEWSTVQGMVQHSGDYFYYPKGEDGVSCWGSARYNAIAQLATLSVAKNVPETEDAYSLWAKNQMDYILGGNDWGENGSGVCLITNFAENSAKYVHHRAASGWDTYEGYVNNSIYDSDGKKLIGAMAGGPYFKEHNEEQMKQNGHTNLTSSTTHGDYMDDLHDYCCNEVAIDYQAGLVGAAAGLYYFYETGELYEIPGVKVQYLPDEEPETQAEETPAPQAEEQQQSDDNSSNTVDTQTESSNTTASETVSSEQNSAETNTETGENSAQVAKLSSRFSNAFSILSVGFSRLATEGTENIITLSDHFTIKFGDSYPVEELCAGKRITAIELVFSKSSSGGGAIQLNGNSTNITASGDRLYLENSDFTNGIPYPLTQIAVMQYGITHDSTLTNIILHFEIPLIITSDKYYLDRNEEFSVDISGHTGDIEWNFDDAPGFSVSPTDNTKLIASGTAGKYTIVGTGSGKTDTIYVEVLPAGTKAYKTSLDWNTGDIFVPDSLKSYEIKRVALKLDKQSSNGSFQVGIDDSSNSHNFSDVPASLYYDIASSVTTKVNVKANYNPDNVVLESMYFIYKVSGNLTINPDTMNVIKGETIDIPVSGANGNVEWVAYQNGNAVNDITFNGNSLTAGNATGEYTITGTDEDGKEGTFTLIVEEFRITSDEQIELTEGDANGTVVEANAEAEWSIPEQYADYITITPADGKTSKITVNATDFTTDEIVLTAKYNEETTDTIRIQINAGELNFMSGNSFKVHVGETTEIGFNLPKGVTISGNDTSIAEIVNDGNVWKIKGISKGNTTFAAIRGNEINGTIEVIDPLAITAEGGDNENKKILIYSNKPQQFTASNFVGTVQWTVSGDGIATISENGLLKPTSAGNVTVTATDADGTTATYDVTIQLGSALVDINGMEPVGEIITISSESEWVATVDNLPVVDANGDYYSYYIVECDKNGNVIENSNPIRGTDGSMYIPISYENGKMLNTGSSTELSVSNRYSGKTQGQMPSSGGVGRTTYYFFGGMIMLLSAAGYTCTRRRQSSRRAK